MFVLSTICDANQTRYGCTDVRAFPAVYMHILDEKRVCGKADGAKYRNAILPTSVENGNAKEAVCEEGFKPCIENSVSTTCYCDPDKENYCKELGAA